MEEEEIIEVFNEQKGAGKLNLKSAMFMQKLADYYANHGYLSEKQQSCFIKALDDCMDEIDEDYANMLDTCIELCCNEDKKLNVISNVYKKHGKISKSDKDYIKKMYEILSP